MTKQITRVVFTRVEFGYPKFNVDFMSSHKAERYEPELGTGFAALTYGEYLSQ